MWDGYPAVKGGGALNWTSYTNSTPQITYTQQELTKDNKDSHSLKSLFHIPYNSLYMTCHSLSPLSKGSQADKLLVKGSHKHTARIKSILASSLNIQDCCVMELQTYQFVSYITSLSDWKTRHFRYLHARDSRGRVTRLPGTIGGDGRVYSIIYAHGRLFSHQR